MTQTYIVILGMNALEPDANMEQDTGIYYVDGMNEMGSDTDMEQDIEMCYVNGVESDTNVEQDLKTNMEKETSIVHLHGLETETVLDDMTVSEWNEEIDGTAELEQGTDRLNQGMNHDGERNEQATTQKEEWCSWQDTLTQTVRI